MQTLIPQPASATAHPTGKAGRALGYGLTPRALWLFLGGLLLAIPAFWHPRAILFMLAWDALLLLLILFDAALRLPAPERLTITRAFLNSPQLGEPTTLELAVTLEADTVLTVALTDDLHPALTAYRTTQHLEVFPREAAITQLTVTPTQRGDIALGRIYLRYHSTLALTERWASALPVPSIDLSSRPKPERSAGAVDRPAVGATTQHIRIFPAHDDTHGNTELFFVRARQLEMQKRRLLLRGAGRDFESLRDYAQGDELRNISWTATARRGKLVTRQFTVDRSQQVWIVLDAGRLSRTALEFRRDQTAAQYTRESAFEREQAHGLTITQLDQATRAAIMLAQVISTTGDKFALLTYGRTVQQLLLPGHGPTHLRLALDLLSQTRSDPAEADHLLAVSRLKSLQRHRGLILWITELADSTGRPELITAAAELTRRHLVVLVLLTHPELEQLAAQTPATREEMYRIAAALEMIERRREAVAQLKRLGVLILQTTPEEAGAQAINQYLETLMR